MTTTPEEALEQAALAGVHRLAVPTPFAVGKVNAYLIEDDPLTLIDGGPNYGSGLDVLSESIAAHGHSIEDIGLILLTHNHTDHLGLAQIVVEHSGAEVGRARHRRGAARQLRRRSAARRRVRGRTDAAQRHPRGHRARPAERLQLLPWLGRARSR